MQQFPPVAGSSYGGTALESVRGREEDGSEWESSTLTGISSHILHGSNLPLSLNWIWFDVMGLLSVHALKCPMQFLTFVPSCAAPREARSQIILVDPQKILEGLG